MPQSAECEASIGVKAKKLEDIERSVRSRVECEERAFHIVNKLIDNYIDGKYLVQCGKLISREHYNDIVEERAITNLCGYPVCPKFLGKTPNKKYHVSTKTNKVYEISERKNFCSSQCFRASRHFSSQIPDSPLWIRDKEQLPMMTLLECDRIRGVLGDEVIGSNPKQILRNELENLEELDKRTSTSKRNAVDPNVKPTTIKSSGQAQTTSLPRATKSTSESITNIQKEPGVSDQWKHENTNSNNTLPIGDNHDVTVKALVKEKIVAYSTPLKDVNDIKTKNTEQKHVKVCDEFDGPLLALKFDQLTTKDVAQEQVAAGESSDMNLMKNITNNLRREHSVSNKNTDTQAGDNFSSKLDHLKALMSKRKNDLLKMVDVQTVEHNQLKKNIQSQNPQSDIEKSNHGSHEIEKENVTNDKHNINSVASDITLVPGSSRSSLPTHDSNNKAASTTKPSSQTTTVLKKSPLLHVCSILKTWVTPETVLFLSLGVGSETKSSLRFSDPQVQLGYGALCHRLAAQEKQMEVLLDGPLDDKSGTERLSRPTKPVPDYKALREQTEALTLNVMEFITGKKQAPKCDQGNVTDEDSGICLPAVDAYDQHQIRVRIVMDRLDKSFPDVLLPLNLSIQDVSGPVRELVNTCRLEKDNIVLKPGEWTLAVLLILKLLATKHPRIESSFTVDFAIRHFSAVLSRLGHDYCDLHSFAESILHQANAPSHA